MNRMSEQIYLIQDSYFTNLWYAAYYYDGVFSHIVPCIKSSSDEKHVNEMRVKFDRILAQIS